MCSILISLAFAAAQTSTIPLPNKLAFESITLEQGLKGHTPQLSRGVDGALHLIWMSGTEQAGENRIQHRSYRDEKWSEPQTLAQGKGWFVNWADFPQYQEDSDGGAILSWLAHPQSGHGYGVMFRKRRESGAAWTMPQVLHADRVATEHGFVSLVAMGEGRHFANWLQSEEAGPPTHLRGGVITPAGRIETEVVLDPLVCDCCGTDSIILPSGNVVVAYRDRSEEEIRDIHVVRGKPGEATTWTKPVKIGDEAWNTATCPVNGPALANDGSFVALVYFSGHLAIGNSLHLATSKGGGNRWAPPRLVHGGKNVLGRVDVTVLPNGGPILMTWLETTEEDAVWCARSITRNGLLGEVLRFAKVPGGRADGFLQLEATEEGAVVAWTDRESGSVQLGKLKLL